MDLDALLIRSPGEGRPPDIVAIKGILDPVETDDVEVFIADGGGSWRLHRIHDNFGRRFVELHISEGGGLTEVRLTNVVIDAPVRTLSDLTPDAEVVYGGRTYRFRETGGGQGYVITPKGVYEDGRTDWVVLAYTEDGVIHLLIYADWGTGTGTYSGVVISDHNLVSIRMKMLVEE